MEREPSAKSARSEKLEADLKEWGMDLEKFRARAERAGADAKQEYERQATVLRARLDEGRARLQEWKKAGSEGTKEMQKGLEAAWTELRKAFDLAKAKFK